MKEVYVVECRDTRFTSCGWKPALSGGIHVCARLKRQAKRLMKEVKREYKYEGYGVFEETYDKSEDVGYEFRVAKYKRVE